jgi:hypothetical protein
MPELIMWLNGTTLTIQNQTIDLEPITATVNYREIYDQLLTNNAFSSSVVQNATSIFVQTDRTAYQNIPFELLTQENANPSVIRRNTNKKALVAGFPLTDTPLRILLTVGVQDNTLPVSRDIEQMLQRTHDAYFSSRQEVSLVEVMVENALTPTKFFDRFNIKLRKRPFHLWQHIGKSIDEGNGISLILPDGRGGQERLSPKDLADGLALNPELRMVIMNSTQASPQSLSTLDVQVVLGFNTAACGPMSRINATVFLDTLYNALLDDTIVKIVEAARQAVYNMALNSHDWAAPVLFASSNNLRFYQPRKESVVPVPVPVSQPPRSESAKESSKPATLLFLAANPTNSPNLRIDEERREIKAVMWRAQAQQFTPITFIAEDAVRYSDVSGHLLAHAPDILHFSGHGSKLGALILEDEVGEKHPVELEALCRTLILFKPLLRCVVFSACYSALRAEPLAEEIDCVIAMGNAIGDQAALKFDRDFYQALSFGKSVDTAFRLGLSAIGMANLSDELETPRLLTRTGVNAKDIFFAYPKHEEH